MERRKFLGTLGAGALAAGWVAPGSVEAQQATAAADRNSVRAADFGAIGDGIANDTLPIQKAIDSAHALGGGTVFLEGSRGRDFRCGSPIVLDDRRAIRIVGSSGPNAVSANAKPAQLVFTGSGAENFITLRSSYSVSFEGVTIGYSDAGYKGSLVATGHGKGNSDPAYLLFDRCRFMGVGRANGADVLLELGTAICSTVRNCEFQGARTAILGRRVNNYSNVIQITDCAFRDIARVPIRNAGESWLVSGCTFEPLISGTGAAYLQGAGTSAWGLVILGCWMGDVSKPGGCWIDMSQAPAYGLSIIGNRMAAPGTGSKDTAIKLGAGNQGVSISGNRIEGAIGIDFTSAHTFGASIVGNDLQCKTPIANLDHAMGHIVAGHYTVQNDISGYTTFQTATFNGDGGVRGSINLLPQNYMPTTPKDGDVWTTRDAMYVRIGGVTRRVNLS